MSTGQRTALLAAGVVAVVAAVYHGALSGGFVFDDRLFLKMDCWQIGAVDELASVWSAPQCGYRRVRYLSLALDHLLWGQEPFGFHLTNLVLHVVVVLLVFGLLRRLGLAAWAAATGALLWGLHPVHTDVVTYVAGRRDVLTTLFFMLALWAWPRDRGRLWSMVGRAALAVLLFGLALGSKEMAITLPVVIVLEQLFRAPLRAARAAEPIPSPWAGARDLLRRYGWALAAVAAVAAVGFVYRGVLHRVTSDRVWGGDQYHHLLTIPAIYAKYLELIVFPLRIYGDYSDYGAATGAADPRVWVGGMALVSVWFLGFHQARRRPYLAFGLLWFGVTMLPVSQIISHHELLAEHYLYLPLIGLAVPVARGVERGLAKASRRSAVAALVGLIALAYSARVIDRNRDFESQYTFARAIVDAVPDSRRGRLGMAVGLQEMGREDEAIEHVEFVYAVTERGDKYHKAAMALLVKMVFNQRDFERATALAEQMIEWYPDNAEPYRVLGSIFAEQGRLDEALRFHRAAYEHDPDDLDGRLHLGVILMRLGRFDEAEEHIRYVAERRPDNVNTQLHWANLALPQRNYGAAVQRFRHVLELDPDNALGLEGMVRASYGLGDRQTACSYLERLRAVRPDWDAFELACPR